MFARHLKRVVSVLLCIAMFIGTMPVAGAVSDIGVYASTPTAGSGSISISWSSVPNVQYYAYSVRNTTTDDLLADRETTSRTSASVRDNFVAGDSYRIWVGACCEGNDPSNTSSWDYTGQVTVTVIGCSHKNTDVAWDTSHSITYKPVSDTKHEMSGYMYEYCIDCIERVGSSYKATKKYEHDYDRNGDCPSCGYTAECPHNRTKLVEKDGYPAYKQDDEEEHIVDIQYERVCRDCQDVIEYVVDSARDYYREPHRYNAKDVCRDCGFVKPAKQEPLTLSIGNNQSNAEVGATIGASAYAAGGTGEYSYAWVVTCNGSVIAETDFSYGSYYSVTAGYEGTYVFKAYVQDGNGTQTSASGSGITVTAPACPHTNRDVSWDTNYSITYTPVSDTEHTMSGYMYEYCTDCIERVGTSYPMTKTYGHDFNANGDCPSCGYTYACKHESTYFAPLGGYPAYSPYDEETHIYDVQYSEYCAAPDCGALLNYVVDSARVYEHQPHSFGANGACSYCGYVQPAKQEPLTLSIGNNQSNAEVGATISASAYAAGGTGEYNYAWVVTCNGSVIAETDFSYGSYYSVTAGYEGTYVFKAYVQDGNGTQTSASGSGITVTAPACPHTNRDVSWDTNYSITYTPVSDTEHTMSGYMYEYCTDCIERVGTSYPMTKTYGHDFNANGDCPSCGYTYACKHESTYFAPLGGYPAYSPYDEETHIYDVQYSEYCAAPDCGALLNYVVDSARVYEHQPHSFGANGACSYCGYVQPAKQEPLTMWVSAGQTTANAGETISANAYISGGSGDYRIAWTVSMNGAVIAQTDMSMGTMYSYRAEHAGTYAFTAIVQDSNGNSTSASSAGIEVTVAHVWTTVSYTEIINQSTTHHDIVTTTYEECTHCGEKTQPVVDRQSVEHVIARTSYEAAHPHQKFNVCRDCSAHPLIEGAYHTVDGRSIPQDAERCCICHGHVWMTADAYEVNGQWRENCANCELYRMIEPPVPEHVHSFSVNVTSAAAHPHQVSGYCECGEFTDFLEVYAKYMNCCQCVGHSWADPVRLPDGTFKQGCFICNEWQTITPSDELIAFYQVFDTMTDTKEAAQKHRDTSNIDGHSLSIWKTVAGQATNKLTEGGFVLTNEILNTYSDMAGSIVGVFSQETWDEQQTDLWEQLLIRMLQEQSEKDKYYYSEASDIKEASKTTGDIAGIIKEYGAKTGKDLSAASQNITNSLDDLDAWLAELSLDMDVAGRAGDFDEVNAISKKRIQLLELRSEYQNELSSVDSNGKIAVETADWAKSVGYAMNVMTVLSAGTESAGIVAERNAAFEALLLNDQRNIEILNSIIDVARSTNNYNLVTAAQNVKTELEKEMEKQTNQFLSETGAFIGAVTKSSAEILGKSAFDDFLKYVSKGTGTFAKGASGLSGALSALGYIELGAKAIKSVVNWADAYDEAQQLMTISHMDATMNIYQALDKQDSQYMADLWAMLQMVGCEKAQTFLGEWESGTGLSTKEFIGSKQSLSDVINNLNQEKQIYVDMLDLSN